MIELQSCLACGTALFPARLRCPRCGSFEFAGNAVASGIVEETTTLFHVAGRSAGEPVLLSTVRTQNGAMLVVRLTQPAARGAPVTLSADAGAMVATPLRA